jgi:hypothetical protein
MNYFVLFWNAPLKYILLWIQKALATIGPFHVAKEQKFLTFHADWKFINIFTPVCYWSLSLVM